jgi:hypothetical protein
MIKLAADENFNNDIVRGLLRRNAKLDILRVQDAGLIGADDPTVLAWAAGEDRVLVTHDVATMSEHAFDRVVKGERMPGVFKVSRSVPVAQVLEDLLLLAECSSEGEWEGRVIYLPLA